MKGCLKLQQIMTSRGTVSVVTVVKESLFHEDMIDQCRLEIEAIDATAPIVLDLGALSQASSGFMGILISLNRKVQREGGALCVCNVSPDLLYIMQIPRLDRLLTMRDSLEEAIEAVAK